VGFSLNRRRKRLGTCHPLVVIKSVPLKAALSDDSNCDKLFTTKLGNLTIDHTIAPKSFVVVKM
jgi:hypothetical protein